MNQKKSLTGITAVILMHVALLGALLHGSKLTVFNSSPPVVDLVPYIEPPKPKEREPQVVEPPLVRPEVYVPNIPTEIPVEQPPTVTTRVVPDSPPAQPPTGGIGEVSARSSQLKTASSVTAAMVDAHACSKPDYPKNALRNGDTGLVMLAFLIGTDGKVADSRIEKSSGFRELDRAAQAGLSLCKFKPGTVDGVPQSSWTKMQYVWSLE